MKKQVLSLSVDIGSYSSFSEKIIELAESRRSSYVCVANVHMCVEAHRDKEFGEQVNNADLITPDGMPIAKFIKMFYGITQERVAGMDLLPDLLKKAESDNLSVFFYGGTEEMLRATKQYMLQHYPLLQHHFYDSPPFRALTAAEELAISEKINATGSHLVFVALGCPKQERWMARMKGKINACMIGIGAALPVMVGLQTRAPKWMQDHSLEWLYRLGQEPTRLFKRYFISNFWFVFLVLRKKVTGSKEVNTKNQ